MSEHHPNDGFLQRFEAIKENVNRVAGNKESQNLELKQAANRCQKVRKLKEEIHYIRMIRNVLAHPKHDTGAPALKVTEDFLDRCRAIQDATSEIKTAGQLGVEQADLVTASWNCVVRDVIEGMRAEKFSHIPVLDEANRVVGVFNESAMFDYLCASGMAAIIKPDDTLETLKPHCRIGADHVETFRFLDPGRTEDYLVDRFVNLTGEFTRLGAVFVTASGKPDEPVQRMITAWDVLANK